MNLLRLKPPRNMPCLPQPVERIRKLSEVLKAAHATDAEFRIKQERFRQLPLEAAAE